MGGQMGGGSGFGAQDGMAAWLESRERRVRALEAENQELRRQVDALRQGAGVTVLIDGHPFALAASTSPAIAGARAPAAAPALPPALPTDTRPAVVPSRQLDPRAAVQRPHVSQPGGNSYTSYAPRTGGSSPHASGYAFEQPWRAPAMPAPPLPALQPSPSLPSMPTTQVPVPAVQPPPRRPRATATHDSSWLTDERPAMPGAVPGSGPRASVPSSLPNDEDAWLRSGAAWPQPTQRPEPPPIQPARYTSPAAYPPRPVSASREQTRSERNVFADSFIL